MGGADGNLRRGSRNGGATARREPEPGTAGRTTYTSGAASAMVDPGREVLIHLDRARKQLAILERTLHDGDSRSAAGASWMLRTALQSARKLLDSADHDGLDVQRDELVQLTAKAEPLIDSPPTTRTSTSTSTSHATSEVRADKVHERAHSADDFLSFEEAPNSIAVETACRQDPATKDIAELVKGVPISTPPDTAEPRNELTSAALAHYLSVRSGDVWRALREYLYPTVWPKTSPRLEWNESVFNAILVGALEGGVDLSERQLRELLHPHDVPAAIAPHVVAPEAKDLPAAVKLVLGQLFRAALGPSVGRMTARYVDVADAMYAADRLRGFQTQSRCRPSVGPTRRLERHRARSARAPLSNRERPPGARRHRRKDGRCRQALQKRRSFAGYRREARECSRDVSPREHERAAACRSAATAGEPESAVSSGEHHRARVGEGRRPGYRGQ